MGPRTTGFCLGTLTCTLIGGYFVQQQVYKKIDLSEKRFESYEKEIQLLQQRMDVVQRGFTLLKKVQ